MFANPFFHSSFVPNIRPKLQIVREQSGVIKSLESYSKSPHAQTPEVSYYRKQIAAKQQKMALEISRFPSMFDGKPREKSPLSDAQKLQLHQMKIL